MKKHQKITAMLLVFVMVFVVAMQPITALAAAHEESAGNNAYDFLPPLAYVPNEDAIIDFTSSTLPPLPYTPVDFEFLDEDSIFFDPSRADVLQQRLEDAELNAIIGTLGTPIGMQGFEGDYAINNPNQVIEIVVQFVTPPATALRLINERGISGVRAFSGASYEEQALSAHDTFLAQLNSIPMPLSGFAPAPEIFSSNHSLFNGVFMRVPAFMAEAIAGLPEVFSVTPNITFYSIYENYMFAGLEADYYGDYVGYNEVNNKVYAYLEFEVTDGPITYDPCPTHRFMRETRELFNTIYIHENIATGDGIIVAVLDSGIDYNHPRFHRYWDEYDRVPGWDSVYNRPDTMEGIQDGRIVSFHGTHVSGSVIAIAPDITLRHYRVLGTGGTGSWEQLLDGLERAHRNGAHVMNLSLGATLVDPLFQPSTQVVNLLAADGVVVVVAAGNSGNRGNFTITSPAVASLAISVGAGVLGGVHQDEVGDTIASFSSLGPLPGTYHIKPDIIAPGAGIVSTMPFGIANDCYTEAYWAVSGTSMASPIVAGVAALLLQQFPNASPYEIKARIMGTAAPLADLPERQNSVFTVGAGRVQPIEALRSTAFATAVHNIPVLRDDERLFLPDIMSSLSFGIIVGEGRVGVSTMIPVEIHGQGPWTPTVTFNGNRQYVDLTVLPVGNNRFEIQMIFEYGTETGTYEGNIVFTNGTNSITMPFAALFVASPDELGIRLITGSGLVRPIITNFTMDPAGEWWNAENDIRHVRAGIDWANNRGWLSFSNSSPLLFGFYDIEAESRSFDIWARQIINPGEVDEHLGDTVFYYRSVFIAPNTLLMGQNVVASRATVAGIDELVDLDEGVYVLFVSTGEGDDYLEFNLGEFVVSQQRPTMTIDQTEPIIYNPGEPVVITGRIHSPAHDIAEEREIITTFFLNDPVFDHRFTVFTFAEYNWALGFMNWDYTGWANSDGTFRFEHTPTVQSLTRQVTIDARGIDGFMVFEPFQEGSLISTRVPVPYVMAEGHIVVFPMAADVVMGHDLQFTAAATGDNVAAPDVVWTIESLGHMPGTTINATGLLTVDSNEAAGTEIIVRAALVNSPEVYSTAVATVITPQPAFALHGTFGGFQQPLRDGESRQFLSTLPVSIWIENTGNIPTGGFTVEVSGQNPEIFDVREVNMGSLNVGQRAEAFVITPIADLVVADVLYRAIVTVSSDIGMSPISFNIAFDPIAPEIITVTLPRGTVGRPYVSAISVRGTPLINIEIVDGNLPPGLNLSLAQFIMISGTPSAVGTYEFTMRASNFVGYHERIFSITIDPAVTEVIINPNEAEVAQGAQRRFAAEVRGLGDPSQDVNWSVTGHAGATIDAQGLLRVGQGVPVGTTLEVRAESVINAAMYAVANVRVVRAPQPPSEVIPPPPEPPTHQPTPPPTDDEYEEPDVPLAPQIFFEDIAGHWSSEYVMFVAQRGMMRGVSENIFAPDATLSRAMVATILWRLEGEPAAAQGGIFSDVATGQWYSEAIAWAYASGIVQGIGGGLFNPTGDITREQLAAMLYRYAQYIGIDTEVPDTHDMTVFLDFAKVASWARGYMSWANYLGLITGMDAVTLNPTGTATRAQSAAILYRLITRVLQPDEQ